MSRAELAPQSAVALSPTLAERCLQAATEQLPVMRATLGAQRHTALGDYVSGLSVPAGGAVQGHADLVEVVRRASLAWLGEAEADELAAALEARPTVLTANHHGVDFFAQSVQSTLALSLDARARSGGCPGATVVLACGAIPLNNLTYPRGLLVYGAREQVRTASPLKLPLFPDRRKHEIVSATGPLDAAMIARAAARLEKLASEGLVAPTVAAAGCTVLAEDYSHDRVLQARSYSEQAMLVNARLWSRMHCEPESAPRLAYLELERIAAATLAWDIAEPASLAWGVLFDPELRAAVLGTLDGARGCWDSAALARRLEDRRCPRAAGGRTGTTLFWGIDESARRVPMGFTPGHDGSGRLVGVSDGGATVEVPLEPVALGAALAEQRLIPSLFTSYLCISLARGVSCLGGYYQAEYLPAMQAGLTAALRSTGWGAAMAKAVAGVTTDGYLSGMQAVLCPNGAGGLVPAGPLEIIAAGGLDSADVERMAGMSIYDAHLGSTVDTVADAARDLIDGHGWGLEVAANLELKLGASAVVKVH